MIAPKAFLEFLSKHGITSFFGVPDSLLAEFCRELALSSCDHVITANEGNAVAMAIGHFLGTGRHAAVYMQNSGLGNATNPLVSLAAPEIYRVGMLLIIGWRGEPGQKDEPQHLLQGQISEEMLKTMRIPYAVLASDSDLEQTVLPVIKQLSNGPAALLVRKNSFSGSTTTSDSCKNSRLPTREHFLELLLQNLGKKALLVSTTGKTSRELFELRASRNEPQRDFLTVGGMGHTLSIALELARTQPERTVICLDGDGSMLMHMGSLAITGCNCKPANLIYILLNNGVHESVGGQPTIARFINTEKLATALNFTEFLRAGNEIEISTTLKHLNSFSGPVFFEVMLEPGSRADLGRPTTTPEENKHQMMRFINDD